MAEIIKRPRGTVDWFYQDNEILNNIKFQLVKESKKYGFDFVDVPLYEESSLFHRSVGESSDIVTKETFDLVNKGDKNYTLRPEFTACINRAVIENKYYSLPSLPLKYSYFGKVFRYERPQKGRYREFHQFGVEIFDEKIDLYSQIDSIMLAISSCKKILGNIKITAKINFLGSFESRELYKKQLASYFANKIDSMCEDCKRRLVTNPLRILDCKNENDQKIIATAPKITDYLTVADKEEYNSIKKALDLLNIEYIEDDSLVRGLDYYTGFIYELYSTSNVGAIAGGGKYSSLMKSLGGPDFEGIGFSIGIERLILSLTEEDKKKFLNEEHLDVFIIDLDKKGKGLVLANTFRNHSLNVSFPSFSRSLNGALKMADRSLAKYVIIIENDEYKLKDMTSREQITLSFDEIINKLVR